MGKIEIGWWLLVVVTVALASCAPGNVTETVSQTETNGGATPMSDETGNRVEGVTLSAEATVEASRLVISYQVHNGLQETIYLVNRVYRWESGGLSLSPDLVYTTVTAGRLQLVKANIDIPDDLDVEAPVVPYLTAVAAGATFSETVTLLLPIQPYHPYVPAAPSETATTFEEVELVVGWMPAGEAAVREAPQPDGSTLLSADYAIVVQQQELLVATLPVAVPANVAR